MKGLYGTRLAQEDTPMPGPLTNATLKNDYIIVPLTLLTKLELETVKSLTTYKDSAIAYQLKNGKRWMKAAQVQELNSKLYVQLWKEVDGNLVLPQGFADIIPTSVLIKDERVFPKLRKLTWFKKPKHELRYYQREAIDELVKRSRGQAVMATGSGKSYTMLNLVREMGLKTLIICPSSLIGDQLYEDFAEHLGTRVVGMYGSGKKEIKQVTIGLYQSVTRNIEAFTNFDLVLCDENQTLGAGSLMAITRQLGHVPYFFSVSATNYRADGRTPEIFAASGPVVYSFDTQRAIAEKWLAQPYFFMRDVNSFGRNYDLKQKNYTDHVVQNQPLTDQIVKDAQKMLAAGKHVLILVQEIEHGDMISQRLGLHFANGENKDARKLIKQLNKSEIKGLVAGAAMAGVGVDTVRVDCLIMASFPGSKGLTTQLVGRGLRKYEGKTKVVILDYRMMGNDMLKRHADSRVEWYEELGPVKEIPCVTANS